jgi:hypothetical protein
VRGAPNSTNRPGAGRPPRLVDAPDGSKLSSGIPSGWTAGWEGAAAGPPHGAARRGPAIRVEPTRWRGDRFGAARIAPRASQRSGGGGRCCRGGANAARLVAAAAAGRHTLDAAVVPFLLPARGAGGVPAAAARDLPCGGHLARDTVRRLFKRPGPGGVACRAGAAVLNCREASWGGAWCDPSTCKAFNAPLGDDCTHPPHNALAARRRPPTRRRSRCSPPSCTRRSWRTAASRPRWRLCWPTGSRAR